MKDYGILGSTWGCPYFGKLPHSRPGIQAWGLGFKNTFRVQGVWFLVRISGVLRYLSHPKGHMYSTQPDC